jgi:Rieske Fe-S protein
MVRFVGMAEVSMGEAGDPDNSARRRLIGWLAATSGLAAVGLHGACSGPGPSDDAVAIPLADLADGTRTLVRWREQPVEVVRTAAGVRARSLICTHMSCTVRWVAEAGRYVCPCHAGQFDPDGNPVAGPPERPLRTVPAAVEGDTVWIGRG